MAGYTIKNLQDVDNSAPWSAGDGLEARIARIGAGTSCASRRRSCARSGGGPEGLDIIAIGADRPEGGDGELVEDFWTD